MTNILTKMAHPYTDEEMIRGFEIFIEEYDDVEGGMAVWEQMNGGRYHYYWDAHVELGGL